MERPTVVFLSLCYFALSFFEDFFSVILCLLLSVGQITLVHSFASCVLVQRLKKKNGTLCWVSPGVGNEGLSNGDSYFILSIIYGETRFRKGHCVNMGVACHKRLEGVQNRW